MRYAPEINSKPLGFILLRDHERAEFEALSDAQRGFFLHWVRSNQFRCSGDYWVRGMRKAREQRPEPPNALAETFNTAWKAKFDLREKT